MMGKANEADEDLGLTIDLDNPRIKVYHEPIVIPVNSEVVMKMT
jgi:hypothetical protein